MAVLWVSGKQLAFRPRPHLVFLKVSIWRFWTFFVGKWIIEKQTNIFQMRRVWDGMHLVIWTGLATATNDDSSFELISILTWPSPFITFIFSSAVGCFKLHLTISQLLSKYYVSERDEMDGVTFQRDSPPLSDAKHCHCWSWRKKENENLYLISIVSVLLIYVFMFI